MQRGSIKAIRLNDKVTSGRQQWLQFHADFVAQQANYIKVGLACLNLKIVTSQFKSYLRI